MTELLVDAAGPRGGQDLATMLFSAPASVIEVPSFAWGFGGLHGGLALSLLAASAKHRVPDHALRSVTGQFHRPIRESLAIDSRVVHSGRSVGTVQVTGQGPGGICLSATAIFGSDQPPVPSVHHADAPDVPDPRLLPQLRGIEDWVPVLSQVDVRPVGPVRPYGGATEPVMTAWMRLRDRDAPVDPCGVVFFLDALPPSYTAVLTEPRPVPTLEFSAHLTATAPTSPWVLVRSRTVGVTDGGWVTESVDGWDQEGTHLGNALQLRLATAAR